MNDENNPNNDILAYKRTPAGEYGTRDPSKDIDLDGAGAGTARGLWSDGTTVFVVDAGEKAYAFKVADGSHDSSKDFTLDSDHDKPWGIWGNSSTFWVVNDENNPNNDLLAYKRTPASEYGTRDASKDIDLDGVGAGTARGIWSDGTTMFVIDGSGKVFAVNLTSAAHDPSRDFELAVDGDPQGLWGSGDTVYVVTDSADDKVNAYYLPDTTGGAEGVTEVEVTGVRAAALQLDVERVLDGSARGGRGRGRTGGS